MAASKTPIPVEQLLAECRADPQWVAMRAEKDRKRAFQASIMLLRIA